MAQRVEVTLVDDLDGKSEASETLRFGLGGAEYEIDLSDKHADQLRTAMAPFVSNGRRVRGSKLTQRPTSAVASKDAHKAKLDAVRAWAKSQGIEINERGRIAGRIIAEYEAAQAS